MRAKSFARSGSADKYHYSILIARHALRNRKTCSHCTTASTLTQSLFWLNLATNLTGVDANNNSVTIGTLDLVLSSGQCSCANGSYFLVSPSIGVMTCITEAECEDIKPVEARSCDVLAKCPFLCIANRQEPDQDCHHVNVLHFNALLSSYDVCDRGRLPDAVSASKHP